MRYEIEFFGHENIRSNHKKTIEITKESHLTPRGDCIVGVNADFNEKELMRVEGNFKMIITVDGITEELFFEKNPDFSDKTELVIRRGEFSSERTLGLRADRVCSDFSDEFRQRLKIPRNKIDIEIISIKE